MKWPRNNYRVFQERQNQFVVQVKFWWKPFWYKTAEVWDYWDVWNYSLPDLVYYLNNFKTLSEAEQFAVDLANDPYNIWVADDYFYPKVVSNLGKLP